LALMDGKRNCTCRSALEGAIITSAQEIPENVKQNLDVIIGKYIK